MAQILPFRTFTTNDGLTSNQIRAICQDQRGYLWVGTYAGGVSRYDGTTFRNYTTLDGLPSMIVWSLAPARFREDAVWIGTWGGLARADLNGIMAYLPSDTTLSRTLVSVYEDFEGTVWCGTARGVQVLAPQDSVLVPFHPDTSFGRVVGISQSGDSTIYIGSWNGLWSYKRGRGIKRLDLGRSAMPENVLAIYVDRHDTLWVNRRDRIVFRYFGNTRVDSLRIPDGYFHQIAEDSSGDLWLASSQGVARIVGKQLTPSAVRWYNVENGLPESAHRAVFVDREANLWLGAAFKGLSRLSTLTTMMVPLKNIPDHPTLATCVQDSGGRYWIAATNGIWEVWQTSAERWNQYFHPLDSNPLGSSVSPRCFDRRGNLWLSFEGGLRCYRIKRVSDRASQLSRQKELRSGREIPAGAVLDAVADRFGSLWLSIRGTGLVALRDVETSPSIIKHDLHAQFPDSVIRTIFLDSQGRLWLGGTDEGIAVLRLDGTRVTSHRLTTADGLPGNHVQSIHETSDGIIWLGCTGGVAGVAVTLSSARIVATMTATDGLLDNAVLSLLPVSDSGLWIGTTQGLQLYSPENSLLLRTELGFMRTPVVSMGNTHDGRLWCLSYDGLRVLDHSAPPRRSSAPPTYIVKFEINDRTMNLAAQDSDKPLTFAYDQNNCTIEFTGIILSAESMLKYKYRLLPLHEEWHGPTATRTVAFPALQPGSYTFEVVALNADGLQSSRAASVSFVILPPLWQTWWFRVLAGAFVVAVLFVAYRYRVRQLLEVERLRVRISSDLHDELASNLSSIALFSAIIREGSPSAKEHPQLLERIGTLAQESLGSIRHLIWAIDPKVETLADLMIRLRDTMSGSCRAKNIALQIAEPSEENRGISLTPEQRQHLWLMLKEAITNAIKHSGATELRVTTEKHGNMLRVEVRDNGCGFDDRATKGKGFATMRMRAELLKGTTTIETVSGKGTLVAFQVKIKR